MKQSFTAEPIWHWEPVLHGAAFAKRPGDLRPWEPAFDAERPAFTRISIHKHYVLREIADRVLWTRAG